MAWKSTTTFAVALAPARHAAVYRVYASRLKSDLYLDAVDRASSTRTSASSSEPKVTLRHLTFGTAPYYYRVATVNGGGRQWSALSAPVNLRPTKPTGLSFTNSSHGGYLTWSSGSASGFRIQRATDARFSRGVHADTIRGATKRFTPNGLTAGRTYYFRVAALNGSTPSSRSSAIAATPRSATSSLRVLTYNVMSANFDNQRGTSGEVHSPWSQRRQGVLDLIQRGAADAVAIQEAGVYVNSARTVRQIDSIASGLSSSYRLANTDRASNGSVIRYAGNYILYKRAALATVGTGGHWDVGGNCTAAYQVLRVLSTGRKFLFVSAHITSGAGTQYDARRQDQTDSLLRQAGAYASRAGVPAVVYSGDFNSFDGRYKTVDTPGNLMRSAGMSDSVMTAQLRYNSRYNSVNNYERVARTTGGAADHVYAVAGVGIQSWGELLDVSNGRYVGVIPSDHNPVWSTLSMPR